MNPEESRIERLKRALYSRDESLVPKEERNPVSPQNFDVPTNWGDPKSFDLSLEDVKKKNNSFFNRFLLGSLGFFIVALVIAMFIFFGGLNMISSSNLEVEVTAPSSVSSGEELSIGLSIINGNRTDLENAVLVVEYPQGSQTLAGDVISRDRVSIGTIRSGSSADHTVRVLLFGEKDIIKSFIFRLEYRVSGSNATFSKEKSYDVTIGSSPVILNVTYPNEVNSGQQITLNIEVTSNSSVPLRNALVKVEYPYGFTYKSSNIKPLNENSVWNLGDLKDGEKKTLAITGSILGQNEEERSFLISLGQQSPTSALNFDTTLAANTATLKIKKSFFDLKVTSNQGNVLRMGDSSNVSINWQNTLPDRILNNKIEAVITGNIVNRNGINVSDGGFYRSLDNTVLWDKNTTNILTTLTPGATGRVSLFIPTLPNTPQTQVIRNPYVSLSVKMSGDRAGSSGGTVSSTEEIILKISSNLGLTIKTLRDSGPFTNSGPVPPKAEVESTYTINWIVTNTTNDLTGGVVTATLPAGVEWKGQVSPTSEKVVYNPDNRTVTWDIGNISYGVGYTFSPKQVYFKVGIVPSLSQVDTVPNLTSQANISAMDTHTEITISTSAPSANTRYADTSFVPGRDKVSN